MKYLGWILLFVILLLLAAYIYAVMGLQFDPS